MKALTLWQPWASLMALREKTIETRPWSTKYRGLLAIHSASKIPPQWLGASRHQRGFRDELADIFQCRRDRDDRTGVHVDQAISKLPFGCVLCIVRLVDVRETADVRGDMSARELIFGNFEDGRYAWFTEMVEVLKEPIKVKGNRLLWNWEGHEQNQH